MRKLTVHAAVGTTILASLLLSPNLAASQNAISPANATNALTDTNTLPFKVGEKFDFRLQVKWGFISGSGNASLAVEALERVHGHQTLKLAFRTRGSVAVFGINDVQRSWLDTRAGFARRFEQKLDQTGYERDKTYDFLPEQMQYVNIANPADSGTLASNIPLDDVSFIYFIRTLPLKVGDVYTASRYFKADGNPVSVRVLRTERITVPAGSFNAVVVKPIIRTKGLFSEGGDAEVWFSDDPRHIPLRVRAKVSVATLTMELQTMNVP